MMAQALKVVFSQKNLARAPGPAGTLKRYASLPLCNSISIPVPASRYKTHQEGTQSHEYFDPKFTPTPWATSLILSVSAKFKLILSLCRV